MDKPPVAPNRRGRRTTHGSVDGFGIQAPWILRKTIVPFYFRRILKTREMAEGLRIPSDMEPKPGREARDEAEALRAANARFGAAPTVATHPIFGPFTKDQWTR